MKEPGRGSQAAKYDALFEAMSCLENTDEVKRFFNDLCTPSELESMADRWQVVQCLREDKTYRDIYATTGVSVTTVGRVARVLSAEDSGYRLVAQRLDKKAIMS